MKFDGRYLRSVATGYVEDFHGNEIRLLSYAIGFPTYDAGDEGSVEVCVCVGGARYGVIAPCCSAFEFNVRCANAGIYDVRVGICSGRRVVYVRSRVVRVERVS